MTSKEIMDLDKFLEDSFQDGIYRRELRLSQREVEYVKRKYPSASIKKCKAAECSDGKIWWDVNLLAHEAAR